MMKLSLHNLLHSFGSVRFVKIAVVISAVLLSLFSIVRFFGLQTYAWDTGVYNQALYTTLFQGKVFFYTADLPANPTGSLLGVHFSPILLLMAPFFILYPSPVTLLVAQSVGLALGAFPLYRYSIGRLGDKRTSSAIVAAYVISPMIIGISWYGFHPEAFLVPAMIGALYYASKQKWTSYFVCVFASLATIETAPVIVALLGVYLGWLHRVDIVRGIRLKMVISSSILVPSATFLVSIVWLVLALYVIRIFNSINPFYFGSSPLYWTVLGAKNIGSVPGTAVTNPSATLNALSFDWPAKVYYLILLFGPLLFLSLRSKALTLLTVPWLGVSLLSNSPPFYQINFQYPAFVAPFIFVGAVEGLKGGFGRGWPSRLSDQKMLRKAILITSLVAFLFATPILPWIVGTNSPPLPYGVFSQSSHETKVLQILKLIPDNASVLTTPNIFPLLSSRSNAFVVPITTLFPPGTSFNRTLDNWLNGSEYVLLDYGSEQYSTLLTLQRISMTPTHGLVAEVDGILLFKRGYTGPLWSFEPAIVEFDWKGMDIRNGTIVGDPRSSNGRAIATVPEKLMRSENPRAVWLQPGRYTVSYQVRADAGWSGSLVLGFLILPLRIVSIPIGNNRTGYNYRFAIETQQNSTVLLQPPADNVLSSGAYQSISYSFRADGLSLFIVQAQIRSISSTAYLDEITISQESS